MSPIPKGVTEMKRYACCSQALVFPRQKAGELISWYQQKPRKGDVDVVIEKFATRNNELRWALTPSVVQHIGRISSKGNAPHKIFNFAFEMNDVAKLRAEHAGIAG